jgi:uncharacterized protein (TIGR03435 family)
MIQGLVARWATAGVVFLVCGLAASRLSGQAPPPPPPPPPPLPAVRPQPPSIAVAPPVSPTGPFPVFEVASVKKTVTTSGVTMGSRSPGGGRMQLMNLPLKQIIMMSWGYRDYQIIGGPSWLTSDRFSISAKAETNAPRDQLLLMMRSLLVERFKLKYTAEKRELPMYALVRLKPDGPLGPNLRPNDCASARARGAAPPIAGLPGPNQPMPCGMLMSGPTGIRASGLPLATLASLLSSSVGGTVLDRTGLTGTYDIELPMSMLTGSLQAAAPSGSPNTSPNPNPNPNAGVSLPTLPGSDGPSVFEAVKDLGLKLERRREPIDVLVIESVEQPDED